jgi:hypothetical protein
VGQQLHDFISNTMYLFMVHLKMLSVARDYIESNSRMENE